MGKKNLKIKKILAPLAEETRMDYRLIIIFLFLASLVALIISPRFLPHGYSWARHTTSQAAAQGIMGAWLGRLGFTFFGFALFLLAKNLKKVWARGAYWFHLSFAFFMVAVAIFSHKPWLENIPYDPIEDFFHSFFASIMGFSFSFGVFIRGMQRFQKGGKVNLFDATAIFSAISIPLLMTIFPMFAGFWQRLMFLVAYFWYGKEAFEIKISREMAFSGHPEEKEIIGDGLIQGRKIIEFGVPEDGVEYILRPGAYAVILNDNGEMAVIETPRGFHLPGGGRKENETPEENVCREVFEECGFIIQVESCLGVADELVYSPGRKKHYRKRGEFFSAKLIRAGNGGKEKDHTLKWITYQKAIKKLSHGSHRWAIARAKEKGFLSGIG